LDGLGNPVVIALDGLDECRGEEAQREIISFIRLTVNHHSTSPLIWLIASGPEPHIRNAFSKLGIGHFEEVEVTVETHQACKDVELYLPDRFQEIRERYLDFFSPSMGQWPPKEDFSEIVSRAQGLFIFAFTVIQFVGDDTDPDPASQLAKIIRAINSSSIETFNANPFAALDALYTEILSAVPSRHLPILYSLLTPLLLGTGSEFSVNCNLYHVSQIDAYSTLRKAHSVLDIPTPDEATRKDLRVYHKSFVDYLMDSSRSGVLYYGKKQAYGRQIQCIVNIFKQTCDPSQSQACPIPRPSTHSLFSVASIIDVDRLELSWPSPAETDHSLRSRIFRDAFVDLISDVPWDVSTIGPAALKGVLEDESFDDISGFFLAFDMGPGILSLWPDNHFFPDILHILLLVIMSLSFQ
jgi:hypothetical protein